MTTTAIAGTLRTPWDCRWSRFADRPRPGALWVCEYTGVRVPIEAADCATCPHWEFQPPAEGIEERACAQTCARESRGARATRALELGIRATALVMAGIFAACGFIILTSPLAIPFTISLWMGAAASLSLGIWGNFRSLADGTFRGFLPPRA
jgi:hypothetical protein